MLKKKKKAPFQTLHLDDYETDIATSFEAGEWQSDPQAIQEKKTAQQAAASYFKKDARLNIRIPSADLMRIKEMAAFEGLPYQTFVSSLLHKLAAGHLSYR